MKMFSLRHYIHCLVFCFFFLIYLFLMKASLFIYFWLCWVFVSVWGLSLVAASRGHSSSRCVGLSLSWPLLLWSTSSRHTGSVVVAHGPSCSAACGIFPDQGSNPCPLRWQADSQLLRHQGSPIALFLLNLKIIFTPFYQGQDLSNNLCSLGEEIDISGWNSLMQNSGLSSWKAGRRYQDLG